jgi:hypothetical protein
MMENMSVDDHRYAFQAYVSGAEVAAKYAQSVRPALQSIALFWAPST